MTVFAFTIGMHACEPNSCCWEKAGVEKEECTGSTFLILLAVDVLSVLGLIIAASLIVTGKIPLSNKVAYGMFGAAGAVALLYLAPLGASYFCDNDSGGQK